MQSLKQKNRRLARRKAGLNMRSFIEKKLHIPWFKSRGWRMQKVAIILRIVRQQGKLSAELR